MDFIKKAGYSSNPFLCSSLNISPQKTSSSKNNSYKFKESFEKSVSNLDIQNKEIKNIKPSSMKNIENIDSCKSKTANNTLKTGKLSSLNANNATGFGPLSSGISTLSQQDSFKYDIPSYRFAEKYSIEEIMNNPEKAAAFEKDYLLGESEYFDLARHPETGISFDGIKLNPATGKPQLDSIRFWSAPSKECLDMALCIKALEGDPKAALVVGKGNEAIAKKKAVEILDKKMNSYIEFNKENPGFGGFIPWYYMKDKMEPADNWESQIPGLDNGEWAWSMLVAERSLREAGEDELADKYQQYNNMLRKNASDVFYDEEAGKVRADVWVKDPKSEDSEYETTKTIDQNNQPRLAYLTGEDGVHEGSMLLMYVSLFADNLSDDASQKIWDGTKMTRIEHKYGTTWRGCWGSAHESWSYLFMPLRDIKEFKDLFRIREKIRSQNAAERGYPGFATSTNKPGDNGYLDGVGIEGVGILPVNEHNNTFAVYGAFPMLMECADSSEKQKNYGLSWLNNMLRAPKMQGPIGGGESGTNDGKEISTAKTIDGTFPNLLGLMGGLQKETTDVLKEYGKYDKFINIMKNEYYEAFGNEPLREEYDFALPTKQVPKEHIGDYSVKEPLSDSLKVSPQSSLESGEWFVASRS